MDRRQLINFIVFSRVLICCELTLYLSIGMHEPRFKKYPWRATIASLCDIQPPGMRGRKWEDFMKLHFMNITLRYQSKFSLTTHILVSSREEFLNFCFLMLCSCLYQYYSMFNEYVILVPDDGSENVCYCCVNLMSKQIIV